MNFGVKYGIIYAVKTRYEAMTLTQAQSSEAVDAQDTCEQSAAVAFVAFCLESYKARHGLSGVEAVQIFDRYGVGEYLLDGYDILHSFGERQIVDDIDRFIEVRKQKEAQ